MASIKLKHASGNSTILNSPAANPSADVTLKLPSTTGSAGQVLQVARANHSATNAELEFAALAAGGKVLRVETNTYTSVVGFSVASGGTLDLTAFAANMTPTSSSNKILVLGQIAIGHDGGQFIHVGLRINGSVTAGGANGNGNADGTCRVAHGGVHPPNNQACGVVPVNYLHSPGNTNQQTYTFQLSHTSGQTRNIFVNYGGSNGTTSEVGRYVSTITLMEIGP